MEPSSSSKRPEAGSAPAQPVMAWVTGIVVYVLVWWITLFAVLPLWVTPAEPDDPGHAAGAPQQPRILLKLAITTVVSALIWVAIYLLVRSPWLSFREP